MWRKSLWCVYVFMFIFKMQRSWGTRQHPIISIHAFLFIPNVPVTNSAQKTNPCKLSEVLGSDDRMLTTFCTRWISGWFSKKQDWSVINITMVVTVTVIYKMLGTYPPPALRSFSTDSSSPAACSCLLSEKLEKRMANSGDLDPPLYKESGSFQVF